MDIQNLSLMTSGNVPPFPSELLGSLKSNVIEPPALYQKFESPGNEEKVVIPLTISN